MKIVKQNDYIMMETTVLGDEYSIICKNNGEFDPIKNIMYCDKDVKKQRIILRTIKNQLKNEGFIFESVSLYHSTCINCGTKISYEDAVVNKYKCCGALTILPEFLAAKNKMIYNVVIFDKKGATKKINDAKPEPMITWLTSVVYDTQTFDIKKHVEPTKIIIDDISAEFYNLNGETYTIGETVENENGYFYYFGESEEEAIEAERKYLLRVKYIINQAKQKEWQRFTDLEKEIGDKINICNNK